LSVHDGSAVLDKSIRVFPTLLNLLLLMSAQAYAAQVSSAKSFYEEAIGRYRAKEYAAAVAAAARALEQDADNAAYHHIYGLSLAALERFREAEEHLSTAITLKPDEANYHYDFGFVLYQQKKYDQCVPVLKRAVDLNGENLMARFLLGRSYVSSHRSLRIGNFSELALQQLMYVAEKNPRFPTIHFHIAQIHTNNGFMDKALQELKSELQYHPSNAQALVALGELLLKTGQIKTALDQLQAAEKIAPNVSLVHYTLAKAYRESEQLEKAIQAARRSLELDSTAPDAHYLLGQLYQETGQSDLARQELELFEKYKSKSQH
jgi:tetratricopeptide (TPR) repeat protein